MFLSKGPQPEHTSRIKGFVYPITGLGIIAGCTLGGAAVGGALFAGGALASAGVATAAVLGAGAGVGACFLGGVVWAISDASKFEWKVNNKIDSAIKGIKRLFKRGQKSAASVKAKNIPEQKTSKLAEKAAASDFAKKSPKSAPVKKATPKPASTPSKPGK